MKGKRGIDCFFTLVLMADPNWNKGFYYNNVPPHIGMKVGINETQEMYGILMDRSSWHVKLLQSVTDLDLNGNYGLVENEHNLTLHPHCALTF